MVLPATTESEEYGQLGISSIACQPPLLEYEEKVHTELIPEEFFQFLYPKTGVTRPYIPGTGLNLYFLFQEINVINPETFSAMSIVGLIVLCD